MIQIDDAGSGSLVGGTAVGILRIETNEYMWDVIPIKYFTSPYFENKRYEDYTLSIIKKYLKYLNVDKNEPIEICQGYIFNKTRDFLAKSNYNVKSTKISDPLQSLIESSFIDYCTQIGIPYDYLRYTKYPFHFHKMLRWVFADKKNRVKLCKTAWNSWKKYSDTQLQIHYDYIVTGNYTCLKCGKKINTPSKIKVIEFTTNNKQFIYLHDNCRFSQ